jgi:hypothetical protein
MIASNDVKIVETLNVSTAQDGRTEGAREAYKNVLALIDERIFIADKLGRSESMKELDTLRQWVEKDALKVCGVL